MIELGHEAIAAAMRATLAGAPATAADVPRRVVIDSREAGEGDLFFGLPGAEVDGGRFAASAIEQGAWGVVVGPDHEPLHGAQAHVFVADDPLAALGRLANAWRHELGARVIGVTGSTGKTSTKDILAALSGRSANTTATPANFNTEIGLPLTVLSAPRGTELLVLEMAMRGVGQIAELARIAEPDVGCIVNVGPVHLEQLGTVENVAAAKAELIAELTADATAVIPAGEPLLTPHRRPEIATVTFGEGGDVRLLDEDSGGEIELATPRGDVSIRPSFSERYLIRNLLAAVACAQAVDLPVDGELVVNFSALRGEVAEVLGGVTLINDCYNANPVSMRAALDNLARAGGRRIAVLGGMGELGSESARFHHDVARHALESGVDLLVSVGDLGERYADGYGGELEHATEPDGAAEIVRRVARPGDTVLVKGSRSVGLERVGELLLAAGQAPIGGED